MKNLILLGTYAKKGNTHKVADLLSKKLKSPCSTIDLNKVHVSDYNYNGSYDSDDFQYIVDQMLESENIILATPVYWFTMSTPLKKFLDRFTDLVTLADKKEFGRKLANKKIFLLITGADKELCEGFEMPFKLTCKYLAFVYLGSQYIHFQSYGHMADRELEKINSFASYISEQDSE